mgnify:CR=1 FL=1
MSMLELFFSGKFELRVKIVLFISHLRRLGVLLLSAINAHAQYINVMLFTGSHKNETN